MCVHNHPIVIKIHPLCDEDQPTSLPLGKKCESMKRCQNDGSIPKALLCKVEFIYSARKFVHSEEYIQVRTKMTEIQSTKETTKGLNQQENNLTMLYTGNKQVSTVSERVLGLLAFVNVHINQICSLKLSC